MNFFSNQNTPTNECPYIGHVGPSTLMGLAPLRPVFLNFFLFLSNFSVKNRNATARIG
jgi:hypothetical protein